jgi:hypothetical protein
MCSDFCSLCVAIMSRVLERREFGRSRMDAAFRVGSYDCLDFSVRLGS